MRLKKNCLIFQTNGGQRVACSAEWVTLELIGDVPDPQDREMIRHAAAAVLYYFKNELQRQCVTVAEFAAALERALRAVGLSLFAVADPASLRVLESQLPELVKSAGETCDLFFFPQLRDELKRRLQEAPRIVRFNGLRPCVKRLAGANRWSPRCQDLSDQIVDYMRTCLRSAPPRQDFTLVVK